MPLLSAVSGDIPGLDLKVEVAHAGRLEDLLIAGDIDAAILAPAPGEPGASGHERFDGRPIAENAFVVAFGPTHRFNAVDELTLENLDGEPLVVRLGCGHEDAIAAAMEVRGVTRIVRHRCADERWLAEMVREGLGCILWPEGLAQARGLPHRALADLPLRHGVALTTMAGRRHSPALAALVKRADGLAAGLQADRERVAS
jgi:DNA-binding transcriptional LysR family regulator